MPAQDSIVEAAARSHWNSLMDEGWADADESVKDHLRKSADHWARILTPLVLEEQRRLLQIVTEDYGDQCDQPDDCACSMAQAIRYIKASHGNLVATQP